jgi:hypothetical protein
MNRILILSYRANGDVYCRGCLMASSNSDFEILNTESEDEAINFLASLLLKEKTEEDGREYRSRDNYVYVNGISKETNIEDEEVDYDLYVPRLDDSPDRQAKALARNLELWAQQEAEKRLALHKDAVAKAAEEAEARRIEQQRQADLRQLEDLKKKLGVA